MLTASVVTFHTHDDELRACLHALQESCVSKIIVIDNASEDRIRCIVSDFSKAEYIPSRNTGYGAGHNKGLSAAEDAGADYHLVLNSDVAFSPEDISELASHMENDSEIGLVHPRLRDADGNDLFTSRLLPTPFDVFIRRFMPRSWFTDRRNRYLLKHLDHDKPHNIPYHQGSFLLLRMKAIAECGKFDERFFMYPEDIDLCRRIHRRYKTLYVPSPVAVHYHRAASYKSWRMLWIHITNMIRYFNKWGWWRDFERKQTNARLLQPHKQKSDSQ